MLAGVYMQKNFRYLDDLIHSGAKRIVLDADIVLDDDEEDEYYEGIDIDVERLVIDGAGHTVDARGKVRIFHVSAINVKINNITLKNGNFLNGGAIFNKCFLQISNVNFESNSSDMGGAIFNAFQLKAFDCNFSNNHSSFEGGAIFNGGKFHGEYCSFTSNMSLLQGGAVYNCAVLHICNSVFKSNVSREIGGAIFSEKEEIRLSSPPYRSMVEICNVCCINCEFEDNEPDDIFEVSDDEKPEKKDSP